MSRQALLGATGSHTTLCLPACQLLVLGLNGAELRMMPNSDKSRLYAFVTAVCLASFVLTVGRRNFRVVVPYNERAVQPVLVKV